MFTTTHDAVLLVLAAMFALIFLAGSAFVIAGRTNQAAIGHIIISALLVVTAVLW